MREEPQFIGRKYSKPELQGIQGAMHRFSEKSMERIDGELDKTSEELEMIAFANDLIEKELRSLGIDGFDATAPERIHILTTEVFGREYPGSAEHGFYSSTSDMIVLAKDPEQTKQQFLGTLVHEMVHRTSTQRFFENRDWAITDARVGYRVRSPWKEPLERRALTGFNEIVLEHTVMKMLMRNQHVLGERFGITKQDLHGPMYSYMKYAPILVKILEGMSQKKRISMDEAFTQIERGQFEENILVLKEVDRIFGKGSLTMLSYMGVLDDPTARTTVDEMVYRYFASEDANEKVVLQRTARGYFSGRRIAEEEEAKDTHTTEE